MNRTAREIIMNRRRRQDERRGSYDYDMRDMRDYRRGVKGTGRYGIGGSHYYGDRADGYYEEDEKDYRNRDMRDYNDYADYSDYRDYNDYRRDYRYGYRDYADDMRLSKSDIKEWKSMLENADGSKGEHFDKEQILDVAEKMGIRFRDYDENELCLTANILYSDYCDALKMFIPQDKEAVAYTRLAKAFLEDEDAPKGSEKLAIYYNCIAKMDE